MKVRTAITLIFATLSLIYVADVAIRVAPPGPGLMSNLVGQNMRGDFEVERAGTQVGGERLSPRGAWPHHYFLDAIASFRDYARGIDEFTPKPRTGMLYVRPEFSLADDSATIQYLYAGNLVGLWKADRDTLEDLHGPIGPMRELIARRGTPEYLANLTALVEEAASQDRIIAWDIEPIPTGRDDWSAEDRDEWIAGHLLLIADARAINPDVRQAIYRVSYFNLGRESRIIYARDGAAGGSLAADVGLNPGYWRDPARLPQEQAMYAAYTANRNYFAELEQAVDFACVHGYQHRNYPPRVWADAEFLRAASTGKPILLWVSPHELGWSDTSWVDLDGQRYLATLVQRYDASVVFWINGADMADQSPEMIERLHLLRKSFEASE